MQKQSHSSPAYHPQRAPSDIYGPVSRAQRTSLTQHQIAPRSGKAFSVPAGHICRISTPEGPQVGDLNIWNLHNPRERFWPARTRQLHSAHVSTGDRLWSCLPYLRPLVTIIGDTLGDKGWRTGGTKAKELGKDGSWGLHDLLGTRCDPYVRNVLNRPSRVTDNVGSQCDALTTDYDFHCHSNLIRAVLPWGLNESDVHDVLNVFQLTGLDRDGRYYMEACPAQAGDYFEFFAEIDILCALSTCPGGDLSQWGWGDDRDMKECCRPLDVEIFKISDEGVLEQWAPPQKPTYRGMHGMSIPIGEHV